MSFNGSIGDITMVDSVNNLTRNAVQQGTPSQKNVPAPKRAEPTATGADGADLTSTNVASELSKKPPVDLEAVNRIKAAIKRGEYPINLDAVAEELMNSYIEMKT